MKGTAILTVFTVGIVSIWLNPVCGHVRLSEPPGRSTMWRYGFITPINYQDNELFCGGFAHQVNLGYKCGLCGDPYDGVRENEAGGKYATGIIARTYKKGQQVKFKVDVTANHKGFFEFKVCPTNKHTVKETQKCFDRYPLTLADGSGTKFYINSTTGMLTPTLNLPPDLVCNFCVVQFRYHTGNSWGTDPDGKSCVGCGNQEEFYGCADIKILSDDFSKPNSIQDTVQNPEDEPIVTNTDNDVDNSNVDTNNNADSAETPNSSETSITQTADVADAIRDQIICSGVNGQNRKDVWCQQNCQMGNCPATECECTKGQYIQTGERPSGCRASGAYYTVPDFDLWCKQNCAVGNCPTGLCIC